MASLSNPDVISISTLNPTDKIVEVFTGSFDTATADTQAAEDAVILYSKVTIPHGFTRPVFTKLRWSIDNVNWVDGGLGQLQSAPLVYCTTYSDSTNVVLLSTDLGTYTIYYQIICFWIDDYDGTNPAIPAFSNANKPLAFDSRLNYQKIHLQGEVSLAAPVGTTSISHGLSGMPNVWVYFESNSGQVWPATLGGLGNPWLYLYSTQREIEYSMSTTALNLELLGGTGTCRVWYRIYEGGEL